jgi:hypothetical protein
VVEGRRLSARRMLRFDVCMGKARGNNREVEMKIPDTVPYRAANEVVLNPTFGIAVAKDSRGAEHINSALPETRFDLTPEKPTSAYKQATSPHSTALTESRLCALGGAPVTSWQRSNVGMNARLYSATRRVRHLPPEKGKKLPPKAYPWQAEAAQPAPPHSGGTPTPSDGPI